MRKWRGHDTHLQTTSKPVVNGVVEPFLSDIVDACPAPEVLVASSGFRVLVYDSTDNPHDQAEDEEADGEDRVVHASLLSPLVTAPPVTVEDDQACKQGDSSHGYEQVLRPWVGVRCPRRFAIPKRQVFGCMENHQGGRQDGDDDETATEAHKTKEGLGNPDTQLDFLDAT